MPQTTVHLMRHGEVHNPEGILYGRLPGYHLSERGYEMAARVAKHFAGETSESTPAGTTPVRRDITHVIASPLQQGPRPRSRPRSTSSSAPTSGSSGAGGHFGQDVRRR